MTNEELLAALKPWLDARRRPGWVPEVSDGAGEPTGSRFGGAPWLPSGEAWPRCPSCECSFQLFLQLDLGALPDEVGDRFGPGLLQLFYCDNAEEECEVELEAYLPFSEGSLVRVVSPGEGAPASAPAGHEPFAPRRITGWSRIEDLPHAAEHEIEGVRYDYDFDRDVVRIRCEEIAFTSPELPVGGEHAELIGDCRAGDKLAGWPYWVQNVEYPSCRRCAKRMELVFQLDSEEHVPYMFGDAGCGHITQCPDHRDELAFGWACC